MRAQIKKTSFTRSDKAAPDEEGAHRRASDQSGEIDVLVV